MDGRPAGVSIGQNNTGPCGQLHESRKKPTAAGRSLSFGGRENAVNKTRQRNSRSSRAHATLERKRTPEEASRQQRNARTLVIIDDNEDVAQTLADLLEIAGHRVEIALSGRSGVELVRRVRPQFVICDLGLPDLNGFEVARILRQDEELRGTRLIALSGYTQQEDQELAREAGFDSHLAKPPSQDDLEALLAVWPTAPHGDKRRA